MNKLKKEKAVIFVWKPFDMFILCGTSTLLFIGMLYMGEKFSDCFMDSGKCIYVLTGIMLLFAAYTFAAGIYALFCGDEVKINEKGRYEYIDYIKDTDDKIEMN